MKLSAKKNSVLFLLVLSFSTSVRACPENLKSLPTNLLRGLTVCQAHDRYKALKARLKLQAKNPERIANLMAPRFINMQDWLKKRTAAADSALKAYEPSPTTWLAWENGAKVVDRAAAKNYKLQKITPITTGWLKTVHATALNGLLDSAGKFRSHGALGLALQKEYALSEAQVKVAKSNRYQSLLHKRSSIVGFVPTICLEDQTEEFRTVWANEKKFRYEDWPKIDDNKFYLADDGQFKQCGYLTYADDAEVEIQMAALLQFINSSTAAWSQPVVKRDPIRIAARAQRWLVAIHPYENGNGRMSRFVMDLVLKSLGLPAPILKEMNNDLLLSEVEWAKEVGEGVLRALKIAETCLTTPALDGCTEVSQMTEGVLP